MRRRSPYVLMCLLSCFLGLTAARAQISPRKIAVLEFDDQAGLTTQESAYVTDLVRVSALKLPRGRYFVITRESISEALPPGHTLADCEADCEVETGRNIGADYVIAGQILRFDGCSRCR